MIYGRTFQVSFDNEYKLEHFIQCDSPQKMIQRQVKERIKYLRYGFHVPT
mgnify:CR=1 FL=1